MFAGLGHVLILGLLVGVATSAALLARMAGPEMLRRIYSVAALLGALMTALGIAAFRLAYQAGDATGELAGIVGILFFGTATLAFIDAVMRGHVLENLFRKFRRTPLEK